MGIPDQIRNTKKCPDIGYHGGGFEMKVVHKRK
jgi:hypothetical protein